MANDLTDLHELQLQAFLRFSVLKRKQHVREEMYSSREVSSIVDGLREELGKYIKKEVENAYHSCALLVKLQLVEAQRAGASITIDTNQLENEALLQQIRAREQAALLRPAADFAAKRAGVLGGLGSAGVKTVADPAVLQQRDRLRTEVEALQSRLHSLQAAANTTMGAKTDLQGQLSDAQAALAVKEAELVQARSALQAYKAAADAGNAAGAEAAAVQQAAALQQAQAAARAAQQQMEAAQQQLKEREAKAKAAEQALTGKLQHTPQWQQMRQLLQEKSQEVMQLRQQLAKYQPQDVPNADAVQSGAQPARAAAVHQF
ncbi:hypothetical protein OEZ85_003810 [Tetradesmus obliquus]|uniref:Leucine zipper transcription factor-like protein 1 n=1 Tax=Tetradesmus obliquus TaxID=3088 RepID=A0ABY8UCH6_TETOB|nr:hypothetical protein OEZ85_003810 [Tetradesmus obliquus]